VRQFHFEPGCVWQIELASIQFNSLTAPDGYDDAESGWPPILKRIAAEAWRRADAGELADEELYCCDAQWSGLYNRMFPHTADEMERRLALAADYGEPLHA
jgi:hypothetical protein